MAVYKKELRVLGGYLTDGSKVMDGAWRILLFKLLFPDMWQSYVMIILPLPAEPEPGGALYPSRGSIWR